MSRIVTSFLLTLVTAGLAQAQDTDPPRAQRYLFLAPGIAVPGGGMSLEVGGGAEWFVHKGVALGIDGGYIWDPESFDCFFDCGFGLVSVDASHHFLRDRARKVIPFVTGGYSLAFRGGATSLLNFGSGFNFWLKPDRGLRVEVRDHVQPRYWQGHLLSFRVGLALR